jgi:hypothetical protein
MVEMAICMGPVSIATNLGCCDDLPRSPCPSSINHQVNDAVNF